MPKDCSYPSTFKTMVSPGERSAAVTSLQCAVPAPESSTDFPSSCRRNERLLWRVDARRPVVAGRDLDVEFGSSKLELEEVVSP